MMFFFPLSNHYGYICVRRTSLNCTYVPVDVRPPVETKTVHLMYFLSSYSLIGCTIKGGANPISAPQLETALSSEVQAILIRYMYPYLREHSGIPPGWGLMKVASRISCGGNPCSFRIALHLLDVRARAQAVRYLTYAGRVPRRRSCPVAAGSCQSPRGLRVLGLVRDHDGLSPSGGM